MNQNMHREPTTRVILYVKGKITGTEVEVIKMNCNFQEQTVLVVWTLGENKINDIGEKCVTWYRNIISLYRNSLGQEYCTEILQEEEEVDLGH